MWRRGIGDGFSAITASGGRLFTLSLLPGEEGEREFVIALDPVDGSELWRFELGERVESSFGNGPRSTPTVVGKTVYAISSRAVVVALSVTTGELRWRRALAEEGQIPRFGYSTSPLVDAGLVIAEAGTDAENPGRSVVALDAATGEERWRALDGPAGYATPIAVDVLGVRQYVFSRREGPEVVSVSADGKVLWRHGTQAMAAIPMPIFLPPDRFFVSSSDDDSGGLMVKVARGESGFTTETVWHERLMRNHFNTSVVVDGFLYGFDNATFKCLDVKTGERKWARRGFGKGSLIAAGDRLVVLGDDGVLALVEATPQAYREHGRTQAMTGKTWTAPSLAGGHLYLRDQDEIVALDLRPAGAAHASERSAGSAAPAREKARPASSAPADTRQPEVQVAQDAKTAHILERHAEARGGRERWRKVQSLRMAGTYAAFSETSTFTALRRRPSFYRLDFELLGAPAVRARDASGPWMLHRLLAPQASYAEEDPYKRQLERESVFAAPLLDLEALGARAELIGSGDLDGRSILELRVHLADGQTETWFLDAETYLEVAVDSEVFDYTQLPKPMRQRIYYDDFRDVEGVQLPFALDWEFGARLESLRVEEVEINPPLDPSRFTKPEVPDANADTSG